MYEEGWKSLHTAEKGQNKIDSTNDGMHPTITDLHYSILVRFIDRDQVLLMLFLTDLFIWNMDSVDCCYFHRENN